MKKHLQFFALAAAFLMPWTADAQTPTPYSMGFESESWPVAGWASVGNGTKTISTDTWYAHGGTRYLQFSDSDSNIAILPQFASEISGLQLSAWWRPESYYTSDCGQFDFGYITDTTDASTFVAVRTVNYNDHPGEYHQERVYFGHAPTGARMALRHRPNSVIWYWFIDDIAVSTAPSCLPPISLQAQSITAHSANITWTAGATETQWQYVCGTAGFTPNWAAAATANTASLSLSGLQPNTTYEVCVRSYCDSTNQSDSARISFRTECAAVSPATLGTVSFEASEGFVTGPGNLANCWTAGNMKTTNTSYMPFVSTEETHFGSNCMRIYADKSNVSDNDSAYAVMPEMAFADSIAAYEAHFYMRKTSATTAYYSFNDTLWVGIVADPADMDGLQIVGYGINSTTTYAQQRVSFNGYTGDSTGYVVFLAAINPNAAQTYKYAMFCIDDITIVHSRTTQTPVIDSVYNITTSTAQVAFHCGNATGCRIMAATEPVNDPETYTGWAIDTTVAASPATISVLPSTAYHLYMQGIGTDSSFISNPGVAFQSGCNVVSAFPWRENFESEATGVFGKACWGNEHVSGPGTLPACIATGVGSNTSHTLKFEDQYATTYTLVTTPELNIPTAAYELRMDVYRSGYYSSQTLEGVQVIVENDSNGYDTTFIPRYYANTAGVGAEAAGEVWYTYTIPLPKAGSQHIRLLGCNEWGAPTYIDNLVVRRTPACPKVQGVAVRNCLTTQAAIGWTMNTASKYQVLLTTADIDPDSLAAVPASTIAYNDSTAAAVDSMVVTGLNAGTPYYTYVRGLSTNGAGDWSDALFFYTACDTAVLAIDSAHRLTEGFDGPAVNHCWTVVYADSANATDNPVVTIAEAGANGRCLRFSSYGYNENHEYHQYIVSPEFAGTSRMALSFRHKRFNPDVDSLWYGVSSTTCDLSSFTWVALTYDTSWVSTEAALPANTRYVAFHYNGRYAYYGYIDDVVVAAWPRHTVTATTNDTLMGAVTGGGIYDYGDTATLTASANTGHHFVDWNDGDTNATRSVTVTSDTAFIANFAINQYTVTAVANDTMMGTVTGGGIYDYGDTATLVATPENGCYFGAWSDGDSNATREIVVTEDIELTATFEPHVGISEAGEGITYTIRPNPTSGSATISVGGVGGLVRIDLLDMGGRTIASKTMECGGDCEKELRVENLAPGTYFVRVTGERVNMAKRLIVR